MNIYLIFWLISGVVLCLTEVFAPTFFVFWFGIAAFISAIISIFFNLIIQIAIFILVSAFLLIFTRPIVKRIFLKHEPPKKINIDNIIGKRALVIMTIDPIHGPGKVKINGDIWRAISINNEIINEGVYVEIIKTEGTKLIVTRGDR